MELSSYSQDGAISLYFLLPFQCEVEECSKLLKYAFQACKEHELCPVWLSHEECLKLLPTKQDVFVCDPFEGEAFEYLLSGRFKCVVLGPRCLLTCLHSKKPVPELPPPLHNMAMHEMVITSTGFERDEKIHIQKLVEKMCGIYSNSFHEGITHLIAKSVGTKKYLVAMEKEIPVMTEEWVEAVWKLSNEESDENVSATHEQFIKYSCPVFRSLIICVSQMPRKEKDMIRNIIEKNGGTYAPNLEMSVTTLLITATAEGEKYKHATQWRIPCVKQDWLHDSVECGFALPQDQYIIKKEPKASTPTSDFHASRVLGPPDVSICSTIMHDSSAVNVNETRDQELSLFLKKPTDSKVTIGVSALEEIDIQEVLKAGHFLDGCKIFASGFDASLNEKLRRIFNLGGAIRLNNMSEAVTHIVVGKHVDEHLNLIKDCPVKPYVVTGEWLVECIKSKKVVEEEKFLYIKPDCVVKTLSPLPPASQNSQKDKRKEQGTENDDHTYVDEELMNQYMTDKNSARKSVGDKSIDCSTLPDTQQSSYGGMFKGLTFTVSGYSEDIEEQLIELICENGGEVLDVKTSKPVKYAIVSLEGEGVFVPNAENYITHIYLEDCFEQENLMPIEYYHMPFAWPCNSTVLNGCVLATSTYKGKERAFISHMAATMGALCQDMFSKRSNLSKGIRASTHLLCPSPEGSKYAAAKKWGIPAVTKDWLLMCALEGCKLYEKLYSVDQNPKIVNGKEIILTLLKKADKLSGDLDHTAISFTHSKGFAVPLNRQVQNIKNQLNNEEHIQTPDADTIRKMYPTPGRAPTTNDSIDEMPTPDTPYGSTWYKNPPARVRKGLKRVLDSMPDDGSGKKRPYLSPTTPEEFYFKKHTENLKEIVANNPFPKPPNFNDVGNSPNQNQCNKQSPEKDNTTIEAEPAVPADHHGPLTGVIVYTSRKLADSQNEIYQAVTELGGDYRWTYDSSVTHLIHYGRMNDTNKEFRIARDEGKFIVAPDWVWMCRDERKRIDESLFPHVHNPKMSLSIISTKTSPLKNRKKGKKKKTEDMVMESQFEEDCDDNEGGKDETRNCTIVQNVSKIAAEKSRESLAKELEELENLAAVTIGGQRKSMNTSPKNKTLRDLDKLKTKPSRSPATQQRPTGNTETESQNTAITWDDPQEREARARLEVALVGDTEDILARHQVEELYKEDKENSPKEANISSCATATVYIEESPKYIIALSGMTDEEKEKYTNIIKCLRGSVVDGKHFDPSVTHIISQKPSRSEKHLAAIASGKWILYRTFLDLSEEAGHFVEEAPHEWGNPSSRLIPSLPEESTEGKLAFAAHRWRIHFGDKGYGAFHSMKVMFFSSKDRVSAFTRLIEAGGGEVIKNLDDIDEVTHCFVEMNKAPKTDLAIFASRKIPCLPPMYLNEFLINYPPPDEMESCIQEYKDIIDNMTFSDISRISRR